MQQMRLQRQRKQEQEAAAQTAAAVAIQAALRRRVATLYVRMKQQRQVVREAEVYKRVCSGGGHPLVAQLFGTFQDSDHLYMLMEFLQGGELYGHLYEEFSTLTGGKGGMKLKDARFYIACVALIFEYLHDKM